MPTTVTPAAHDASIASRAVTPSNDEPYPTLVGTATTGAATSPPTTLASAPSMPATTTTASTVASSSRPSSSRWSPATPTSVSTSGVEAVGRERGLTFVRHGAVGGAGGQHGDPLGPRQGPAHHQGGGLTLGHEHVRVGDPHGGHLVRLRSGDEHRSGAGVAQFGDDACTLGRGLARAVDHLGPPLALGPVMVDLGVAEIGERQPTQAGDGLVGCDGTAAYVVHQCLQVRLVHVTILPP